MVVQVMKFAPHNRANVVIFEYI